MYQKQISKRQKREKVLLGKKPTANFHLLKTITLFYQAFNCAVPAKKQGLEFIFQKLSFNCFQIQCLGFFFLLVEGTKHKETPARRKNKINHNNKTTTNKQTNPKIPPPVSYFFDQSFLLGS